jgi:ATP-dependent Clp protease protease subunit
MLPKGLKRARELAAQMRGARPGAQVVSRGFRMESPAPGAPAVLYIYDEIGKDPWDGSGICASDVIAAIAQAKSARATSLEVRVLSGGGDAFEGVGIYEALKRCELPTTAYNDGLAASAASYVLLGCNRVVSAPTATTMVHCAWTLAMGNAKDMRDTAGVLDVLDKAICGIYATEAGGTADEWLTRMSAETWLSADECKAIGFCDEIARADDDNDAGQEPDGDPDDAPAAALWRMLEETQARNTAFANRARLRAAADTFTRASPGSTTRSGQSARQQ